jgi:hypothetical protein
MMMMQMTLQFSDTALTRTRDHHFVTSTFDEETNENASRTFKKKLLRLTTKLPRGIGSVGTFKPLMTDKKAGLKADSKAKEDAELLFSFARLMCLIDDTFEGSSLDVLIFAHEQVCATKSNVAIATAAAPSATSYLWTVCIRATASASPQLCTFAYGKHKTAVPATHLCVERAPPSGRLLCAACLAGHGLMIITSPVRAHHHP